MVQKKVYKICLISEQLASGGAERCAALLSQFFESQKINVHHIIVIDKVEYEFSGELLNLGLYKTGANTWLNKLKRLRVLKNYLNENTFDFIIDFRVKNNPLQEFFIARFLYDIPYIQTVHSYMTELYFPKKRFLDRNIYTNAYGIVVVSKKIKKKIADELYYKKVKVIHNPISIDEIAEKAQEQTNLNFDYVLSVGRMDDGIKQFDKLILAFAKSILPSKNIKLVLLGDGVLRKTLETQVNLLGLEEFVLFLPWSKNPFKFMRQAKFSILSSKNEGFGNVLIESLACQTPVISFDCLSGPSEIITHNYNGLLVKNQNFEALTLAINTMVEDEKLYHFCKENALNSVQKFSLEIIGRQWLEYLKIDVS